ncbi:MAG: ribonuclease R [Gemmataceae bacterium]
MDDEILEAVSARGYSPLKSRQLAKKLNVSDDDYPQFRRTLKKLIGSGQIQIGGNNTIRKSESASTVIGTYRRTNTGIGFVRPRPSAVGMPSGADIRIRVGRELDAATGDEVLVKLTRRASQIADASGDIIEVIERATRSFVGEYFERDGVGLVRIDGTVFAHSVAVGDPGAKGARPHDKVVVEMIRFPTADERGEGAISEVLGPHGKPGVDALTVIRGLGLPDEFPPDVLDEARAAADQFRENDLHGRTDFTEQLVITIDPVDARDFDDAVSVEIDAETGNWLLTVHIADVGHFAPAGSKLDQEARKRATSVYLPQRVIPMFPELISNGLASLQADRVRFVKTAQIEYLPNLQIASMQFFNGAIKVRKRFAYEEVQQIFDGEATTTPEIHSLLKRMRDLAARLRKKRKSRGTLELEMPEPVLEYDKEGRVTGAHFANNDESHRVIEEFMLAANEAVATHLTSIGVPFLRRVHPAPNEEKLEQFAEFAGILGYPMKRVEDRFELQRVLRESTGKPERAAIHYALLRSLKQAAYSPIQDQHYALASNDYCHFTSPIRRYPDLTVHRLLDRWIKHKKVQSNEAELVILGDHCSKRERRAETAERELVKLKLLTFLSSRIGERFDAVVTGVADYGFFAQAEKFPAEGLVHISSLTDDYYRYDESHRALFGGRMKKRYRLGDRVAVEVARVDLTRRLLDFRVVDSAEPTSRKTGANKGKRKQGGRKGRKRR